MEIYSPNFLIESIERNNKIIFELENEEEINEAGTANISNKYKYITKYKLCIMNNEGKNIPHFHVVKGTTTMCYICLNIPIYFDHGDGILNPLSSKESKQLYEFMKTIHKTGVSAYQFLCNQWNRSNNSKFQFPSIVPDYSKLDSNITNKTIDIDEYRKRGKQYE